MPCSGKAVVDAYPPPADPRTTVFRSLTGPRGSPWIRSRAAYGQPTVGVKFGLESGHVSSNVSTHEILANPLDA